MTETNEQKRPGRPRKFGQGRITSTVRHTPERYAELKAAAETAGRSVSEQVEFELEDYRRVRPALDRVERSLEAYEAGQEKFIEKHDARVKRLEGIIETYKTGLGALTKLTTDIVGTQEHILAQLQNDRVATDERIARTVADAVAHAFDRRVK